MLRETEVPEELSCRDPVPARPREAAVEAQGNAVTRVDHGRTMHQWHGNWDVSCRTEILRDSVAKDNGGDGQGELKCLPHKHEDWNPDLQNPRKCQVGVVVHVYSQCSGSRKK